MSNITHGKKGGKRKIVIGNWKMNPQSLDEAKHIIAKTKKAAGKLERTTVVVCPPFPFIPYAVPRSHLSRRAVPEVAVGAQNVSFEESGAFTGEVSAGQLSNLGVSYVIVGHSERRYPRPAAGSTPTVGESDLEVSRKAVAVVQAGMTAVLCCGEKTRDGQGEYLDVLRSELKVSLQAYPKKSLSKLIVAYEPIWAVGGKAAMTPDVVQETTLFIKKVLSDIYGQHEALTVPILYGGAVNFRNAGDIITLGQVDGLLVGRESVNVPGFVELLQVVDTL